MPRTWMNNSIEVIRSLLYEIDGVKNVYLQPPATIKMEYPCIICVGEGYDSKNADNDDYLLWPEYKVTVIDYDLNSSIAEDVRLLKYTGKCSVTFSNSFAMDNLYHWVFSIKVLSQLE